MTTSWSRGQSLCLAPGLVVPHEPGKDTGSQTSIREDSIFIHIYIA